MESTAPPSSLIPRLAALGLIAWLVVLALRTTGEARAEMALPRLRAELRASADDAGNRAAIDAAVALDPANPDVRVLKAMWLLDRQRVLFLNGAADSVELPAMAEGIANLDRAQQIAPFQPEISRLHAEALTILSQVEESRGLAEQSQGTARAALAWFLVASGELPLPVLPGEGTGMFLAAHVTAARRAGRPDVAMDFIQRVEAYEHRYLFYDLDLFADVWDPCFTLGMWPQMVREFRYGAVYEPDDPIILPGLENIAEGLGGRLAVLSTLDMLARDGKLTANGRALRDRLRHNAEQALKGAESTGS